MIHTKKNRNIKLRNVRENYSLEILSINFCFFLPIVPENANVVLASMTILNVNCSAALLDKSSVDYHNLANTLNTHVRLADFCLLSYFISMSVLILKTYQMQDILLSYFIFQMGRLLANKYSGFLTLANFTFK